MNLALISITRKEYSRRLRSSPEASVPASPSSSSNPAPRRCARGSKRRNRGVATQLAEPLLFSVLHRTFSMAWARLFLQTLATAGVAAGQLRAGVLDLVGLRLPRPYHFPARIQSFQAVAAPFPGDSVLPRASPAAIPTTETPRFPFGLHIRHSLLTIRLLSTCAIFLSDTKLR